MTNATSEEIEVAQQVGTEWCVIKPREHAPAGAVIIRGSAGPPSFILCRVMQYTSGPKIGQITLQPVRFEEMREWPESEQE